jgi:alkylation response protein AidB-like acyl-CoA dehydrogenase|nr:acyl-CoA dehydrogenase family protein [Mycobacterium conspicuum]
MAVSLDAISAASEHQSALADLRDMVRRVVAKHLPLPEARHADAAAARRAGWTALAELGLLGIAIPEHYGGSGAGLVEQTIVCEELARELGAPPYLATACLAGEALLASGDESACAALLPGIAAGELAATVADGIGRAERAGQGWVVSGDFHHVPDGADADVVLMAADTDGGPTLFAVEGCDQMHRERLSTLDTTRPLANLRLVGAPGRPVGVAGAASSVLASVRLRATALLAAEQAVLAEQCVELTRRYLLDRRQFGRQIGGFQALKHRLADAAVRAELCAGSAWYAIQQLAAGAADAEFAVLVAAAACGDAALQNAAEMIQLHGGIGYTWEHFAHLYLRRAKADQYLFGTPSQHRDRLGAAVVGNPSAPTEPAQVASSPAVDQLRRWLAEHLTDEVAGDNALPPPGRSTRRCGATGIAGSARPGGRHRPGHPSTAAAGWAATKAAPSSRSCAAAAWTDPRKTSSACGWPARRSCSGAPTSNARRTCARWRAASTAGASCSVSRAPDPIWPRWRPRRCASTAIAGWSTGRRSGVPSPTRPTSVC